MKRKKIEYPHPVLDGRTNDYIDSNFSIRVLSHNDDGADLVLNLKHDIECDGMIKTLSEGKAKVVLRLHCYRTSLRKTFDLKSSDCNEIRIPKKEVADSIYIQALIVASDDIKGFVLPEFNKAYFEGAEFDVRKGDILAVEPGITIKMNTILEKNMAGIVLVREDSSAKEMSVHYSEVTEENPDLSDYIVITLPETEYLNYAKMLKKKYLKNGVDRFIQASVVLPAITEAVGKLREEESFVGEDEESISQYKGTIWADSIYEKLREYGISDLEGTNMSDYEIANKLLGDVVNDSINNLYQKLIEWSSLREEDPTL